MLRLQALEERIVLDAALMVGLDEVEREDVPDAEAPPAGGEPADAGIDARSADFAAAALSLIDPLSLAGVDEVLPAPLQYREGDGVRSVLAASEMPVLAPSEGYALWATVSLEGASAGDELLAPDSAGEVGGFIVTRSGEYSITLTATDSLLLENLPSRGRGVAPQHRRARRLCQLGAGPDRGVRAPFMSPSATTVTKPVCHVSCS